MIDIAILHNYDVARFVGLFVFDQGEIRTKKNNNKILAWK